MGNNARAFASAGHNSRVPLFPIYYKLTAVRIVHSHRVGDVSRELLEFMSIYVRF